MIVDFLTAGIRTWADHGHPLLMGRVLGDYRKAAEHFESINQSIGQELEEDLSSIASYVEQEGGRDRILFIRPKMASLTRSAINHFQVLQLEIRPTLAPYEAEDGLHLSAQRWIWLLSNGLSTENEDSSMWLQWLFADLKKFLELAQPSLICFSLDLLPLERAISMVAKTLGIPTTTIQDGVFSSKIDPALLFGEASDSFLVWGNHCKQLLVAGETMNASSIYEVGYPYPIKQLPQIAKTVGVQKSVVFLGQNFETFSLDLSEAKQRLAHLVHASCVELGLDFKYRPHPGEARESLLDFVPEASLLPKDEPLLSVFSQYDCFVGLTSSALVEAALHGKIAIQIYEEIFKFDHLGELGACHCCDANAVAISDLLKGFAEGCLLPLPVNSEYISVPTDIEARFVEIYRTIISESKVEPEVLGAEAFCIAGVVAPSSKMLSLIPPRFGRNETGSALHDKPIEALACLSYSCGLSRSLPVALDLEESWLEFSAWSIDKDISIYGEFASYSQGYFKTTRKKVTHTIEVAPPKPVGIESILWLLRIVCAFHSATTESLVFFAPASNSPPISLGIGQAWDLRAVGVFLTLKVDLTSSEITEAQLAAIRSLVDEALLASLEDLKASLLAKSNRRIVERQIEHLNLSLSDLKFDAQSVKDEFDRVRATKFWRLREKLASIRSQFRR